MSRWEPDARGRLTRAALRLYGERGFEQTTVAEIAKCAGVTERTFFRHFADKREVLFGGSETLEERFAGAVADAPPAAAPMDALAAGLDAVAGLFADRRAFARERQTVIMANAELRERELTKLASLSAALAGALRTRGVAEPAASLAAEAGVAVFKVGFERWLTTADEDAMAPVLRETLTALRAATAGS
ncbi:TetR/AcrR family transcriptional regulator [Streptomyces sp. RFCAC02]|uniref:TetR/AcrR family transcriptional regulator n=1 Tax=Streptomyces sp. RFCAC02 TaxID=2499143 RepID=UPI001021102C|nr:TetR/AcrR family transcriptional regulator [Streptomyces sp. RFCAC02]